MKKLLVTGGAGFIGSEFCRQAVSKNYQLVVVDNISYAGDLLRIKEIKKEINFYRVNILNLGKMQEIFKKESPQVVVHFAAETHVDRSILNATPFLDTNIKGTQILLELSKKYQVEKFINISTDEVYGELGEEDYFLETSPLNPNSPYSVSKTSADMLGRAYFRTYDLPVITIRPSNNYGPWQYPEKLIPVVILKALNNERIPVYGKGLNVREWIYVSDCVKAILKVIEKGKIGEIYNVGSGEEKRNIEVVKTILKLLNKSENLIEFTKDRLGHDFRYSLCSEKIKKQIGWKKEVSFEKGIEETVNWNVKNFKWLESKLNYLRKYWKVAYNN